LFFIVIYDIKRSVNISGICASNDTHVSINTSKNQYFRLCNSCLWICFSLVAIRLIAAFPYVTSHRIG
jgi:hypothetical protein